MKIKRIISQHRRDFRAIYQCEHCDHEHEDYGYDDDRFHQKVIPAMKCKQCGKSSPTDYSPLATKYDSTVVI